MSSLNSSVVTSCVNFWFRLTSETTSYFPTDLIAVIKEYQNFVFTFNSLQRTRRFKHVTLEDEGLKLSYDNSLAVTFVANEGFSKVTHSRNTASFSLKILEKCGWMS